MSKTINYLVPFVSRPDALDFDAARETPLAPDGFANEPAPNATFGELPPDALKVKSYAAWKQQVLKRLVQRERLELFQSDAFDLVSEPGESERDFRARLQARARETRDELTAKLRQKYAGRTAALTERIRRAEQAVARESEQMKSAGWQTAVSLGATVLGALLGRKTVSASTVGRATTTARGGLRSMKEREDVQRAEENVQALKEQLAAIEAEAAAAIEAEGAAADPRGPLGRIALEPKPSKSGVEAIALAWIPMLLVLTIATTAGAQTKPRARDLGIPFDGTPGPLNAITDVGGVEVGLTTLTAGPARTGVTAILPRGKSSADPAFAGWFSLERQRRDDRHHLDRGSGLPRGRRLHHQHAQRRRRARRGDCMVHEAREAVSTLVASGRRGDLRRRVERHQRLPRQAGARVRGARRRARRARRGGERRRRHRHDLLRLQVRNGHGVPNDHRRLHGRRAGAGEHGPATAVDGRGGAGWKGVGESGRPGPAPPRIEMVERPVFRPAQTRSRAPSLLLWRPTPPCFRTS